MRLLAAIQLIALLLVGVYAYSWKVAAEAMSELLYVDMLAMGQIDAATLLEEGQSASAVSLLRVLLEESARRGRVCGNERFQRLEWTFPMLLVAVGAPDSGIPRSFDLELRTLLAIGLGRSGDPEGRERAIERRSPSCTIEES